MSVFEDYIVGFLTRVMINILSLIIIFMIIKILLKSITSIFDIIDKIPVVHGVNRLLGALVGFSEGAIIICLFFLFMMIFTGDEIGQSFYGMVESDPILSFIYNNNIFLHFVL